EQCSLHDAGREQEIAEKQGRLASMSASPDRGDKESEHVRRRHAAESTLPARRSCRHCEEGKKHDAREPPTLARKKGSGVFSLSTALNLCDESWGEKTPDPFFHLASR